jgi:2-polyprenyl-6-hydroxyphenyl methylase/3-demethylubiquinone-9 3-methyltransferase
MDADVKTHPARRASLDGYHVRAAIFHPARTAYVQRILVERLGRRLDGLSALVIGAGGGILAQHLAGLGMAVSALRPSAQSVAAADALVRSEVGDPRRLPYADATFDVVYTADTLETTADLDGVLAETGRVLRNQGAFLYDTVNRTTPSRVIYLGVLQTLPFTRVMQPGTYTWDRLRPPAELAATMAKYGLRNIDVTAFRPGSPLGLIRAILKGRRGNADDAELGRLARMELSSGDVPADVTYLGAALKED